MKTMGTKNQHNNSFTVVVFASLGSCLEYYDFVIYGMMAKYLGDIFFPSQESFSSVMQAFSIFAVGYFIRPFGGIIFGFISDIYGRKKSFVIIMLTMSLSTLSIGLLPTYQQAGILAPIILIICRLLQGISFGAELPSATTIVSEYSPRNILGKLCSFVLSSISLGSLLAAFILAILTKIFSYDEIIEWGWRIPFLLGGTLAILAYCIRKNISETPEFVSYNSEEVNYSNFVTTFHNLIKTNLLNMVIGFGLVFFLATIIIVNLYFPVYISKYFNYKLSDIYSAMTGSMIASCFFMLVFGQISDYISKIKILLFTLIGFSISLYPLYLLLNQENFLAMQIFFIVYQLWIALFFTSYLPIQSRLLPVNIRCTGTALTYNLAFAIASTIPTICAYFFADYESPFFLVVFFILAVTTALISIIILIIKGRGQYTY